MPNTLINESRLGQNIRYLREAYGETVEDVMHAIGASSSGNISYYESGKKIPSRDTLINIAKHFLITEDELLYGDFSFLNSLDLSDVSISNSLERVLPLITSEIAMECFHFRIAYKLHCELLRTFRFGVPFNNEMVQLCKRCYVIAAHKGILEATANRLWWLFIEGITIRGVTPYILNNSMRANLQDINLISYIKEHYLWKIENSQDNDFKILENARKDYIKDIESEYVCLLKKLKKSSEYSDLADYYSALRYMYGLVDNNLTYEMNTVVGQEMFRSLATMENTYAVNLVDCWNEII